MSVRLLANENFPLPSLKLLREAGIDVIAVRESMPAASDEAVMAFARSEGRWILTFDRDYGDLVFHRGYAPPPAILYLRQEPVPPTEPARAVLDLAGRPNEVVGYLVVVSQQSIRKRRFPDTCPT